AGELALMGRSGRINGGNRPTSSRASKTYSLKKPARNIWNGIKAIVGRDPTSGIPHHPLRSKRPLSESACRRLARLPSINTSWNGKPQKKRSNNQQGIDDVEASVQQVHHMEVRKIDTHEGYKTL